MSAPQSASQGFAFERNRVRRSVMVTVLLAVVAFMPLDLLSGAQQTPLLTASRIIFLLTYAPAIALLSRLSERAIGSMLVGVSIATSLALTLMCAGTGGSSSPAFSFLWALPLAMGLLFLDQPRAALLSGISTTFGALFLLRDEGRPVAVTAYWVMVTVVSTFISTTATTLYRRVQRIEIHLERQRAEALEQLAESERERALNERLVVLGRLAAGVAHEVNNPLAFVRSNLSHLQQSLLEGQLHPHDDWSALLTESLQGIDRIATITQDLRSYVRRPNEGPAPAAIGDIVDEALRLTRERAANFSVHVELEPELPLVKVNRGGVVQVLVNLINNAADALEQALAQGKPMNELRLTIRGHRDTARVRVEVEDSGAGLAAELTDRLFQPFVTTKPPGKGAGLGLALSFELIQRQGGLLVGGNAPHGGARFSFSLPCADENTSTISTS